MKIALLPAVIVLLIASAQGATGYAQSTRSEVQDWLSIRVENLELEADNIHLLLLKLSNEKRIPIGLEVSSEDDLSQTRTIRVRIKQGTLADVLNSIVEQNPLYTWRVQDDVVNVIPLEPNRDQLLRSVLEKRLEKFSIARGTSRLTLRQTLSKTREIRAILNQGGVVPNNQSFMSRDVSPLGRQYGLEATNISVSELLNRVIRESQTKYWIVMREGEKKQYFVLNL